MAIPVANVSESTWRATLLECKRMGLAHLRRQWGSLVLTTESLEGGEWESVESDPTAHAREYWPQQQWHTAFEILVCKWGWGLGGVGGRCLEDGGLGVGTCSGFDGCWAWVCVQACLAWGSTVEKPMRLPLIRNKGNAT
jgi:hypothetical protein